MQIETIKQFMKANKITYEELAQKSGVSVSTLKKIFAGISQYPRLDTMQAIENALGIADLTDNEISQGVVNTVNNQLTALEEDMLIIFREVGEKLGEPAQRVLITTGENLLKINK